MTQINVARHQGQSERAAHRLLWLHLLASLSVVLTIDAVAMLVWSLVQGTFAPLPLPALLMLTLAGLSIIHGAAWVESRRLHRDPALIAARLGAQQIDTLGDPLHRRLQNLLEELAIGAHVGVPRAFVLENDRTIDALTVGFDRNRTVVLATRGALLRLTREELRGMLAHEIAHVVNGDTWLNTWLLGMNHGLRGPSRLGRAWRGAAVRSLRGWSSRPQQAPLALLQGLAGLVLAVVGMPFERAARAIETGVGGHREFAADALAIELTGQLDGLATALRKQLGLRAQASQAADDRAGNAPQRQACAGSLSLLWFADAGRDGGPLSAYPSIPERVRRILGCHGDPIAPSVLGDEQQREAALPELGLHPGVASASRPPAKAATPSRTTELLSVRAGERAPIQEALRLGEVAQAPATAVMRLVRATREPAGAAALVIALLDKPGLPAPNWDRNWLVAAQRFGALQAALAELPPASRQALRWPLLELAVARLGPLSRAVRLSLLATARDRVLAHVQALPREWIYLVLLKVRLDSQSSAARRSMFAETTDARSIRVLFALIAQDAGVGEAKADRAANAAIRELALAHVGGTAGELTLESLERAVDRVLCLPPLARPVLAAHLADFLPIDAEPGTIELLRLLCLAIDCPRAAAPAEVETPPVPAMLALRV